MKYEHPIQLALVNGVISINNNELESALLNGKGLIARLNEAKVAPGCRGACTMGSTARGCPVVQGWLKNRRGEHAFSCGDSESQALNIDGKTGLEPGVIRRLWSLSKRLRPPLECIRQQPEGLITRLSYSIMGWWLDKKLLKRLISSCEEQAYLKRILRTHILQFQAHPYLSSILTIADTLSDKPATFGKREGVLPKAGAGNAINGEDVRR